MAWFKDWFNSPYYHILYGQHNDAEAALFINNLSVFLGFKDHQNALDLACGKGRHSKQLASHRLQVTGIDLSEESIKSAQLFTSDRLNFEVHDMRKVYKKRYFEYVFNIFTSFGYFSNAEDNISTLAAVKENLKTNGVFIQDFFNASWVINQIVPYHEINAGGILFKINKSIKDQKIIKTIEFNDQGEHYQFCEVVDLFTLADFEQMYKQAGLKILHTFGDYELGSFNPNESKRLILISQPL
ncbi:MAG: class I SAM-dependent methyltransferase [bacterium]|nr:class I SAM-dependent methyltransferase [bacterium]